LSGGMKGAVLRRQTRPLGALALVRPPCSTRSVRLGRAAWILTFALSCADVSGLDKLTIGADAATADGDAPDSGERDAGSCPVCNGAACCAPRVCEESACCNPLGASCSSGACCSGTVCNGAGACAAQCSPTGQVCASTSECCKGSVCPSGGGVCTPCKASGDACNSGEECCNGRCVGNKRCQ
jgi:hypothetical protein